MNQDDGDKAQANLFALVAGLVCQVPVLRLVTRPAKLRRARVDVGIE
jgi:hypothetical protein